MVHVGRGEAAGSPSAFGHLRPAWMLVRFACARTPGRGWTCFAWPGQGQDRSNAGNNSAPRPFRRRVRHHQGPRLL